MGWSGCESQIVDFGKLQYYCRTQTPLPPMNSTLKRCQTRTYTEEAKPPTSTSHRLYVFSCLSCISSCFIHHKDIQEALERCPTVKSPSKLLNQWTSNSKRSSLNLYVNLRLCNAGTNRCIHLLKGQTSPRPQAMTHVAKFMARWNLSVVSVCVCSQPSQSTPTEWVVFSPANRFASVT